MKTKTRKIDPHPLAELFPLIPAQELAELARDIKANGLQHPIVLFEGKILDGRHRLDCCERVGVRPRFTEYKGDDPLGFVISLNMRRRHLDVGQRAMIAAQIANMSHGGDRKTGSVAAQTTRQQAADVLNVSPSSVSAAKRVIEQSPALADKVKTGEITLGAAKRELAEAEKDNEELIDETGFKIPQPLNDTWRKRDEVVEIRRRAGIIESWLTEMQNGKHPLLLTFNFSEWIATTQRLTQSLSKCIPFAVCPTCGGWNKSNCAHCKGVGFLSRIRWQTDVPEEIKIVRKKQSKTKNDSKP